LLILFPRSSGPLGQDNFFRILLRLLLLILAVLDFVFLGTRDFEVLIRLGELVKADSAGSWDRYAGAIFQDDWGY
jgi:hypothetical protein